jgi:hypothetical protein
VEKVTSSTYKAHLTQQQTRVNELFLIPFDTEQVKKYVEAFVNTPEAYWKD